MWKNSSLDSRTPKFSSAVAYCTDPAATTARAILGNVESHTYILCSHARSRFQCIYRYGIAASSFWTSCVDLGDLKVDISSKKGRRGSDWWLLRIRIPDKIAIRSCGSTTIWRCWWGSKYTRLWFATATGCQVAETVQRIFVGPASTVCLLFIPTISCSRQCSKIYSTRYLVPE